MIKKLLVIVPTVFLISCADKKIVRKEIKLSKVAVKWYYKSFISNTRAFVEASDGHTSEIILDCNDGQIIDIGFKQDTIVIKTMPRVFAYSNQKKAFGYFVKIDSTGSNQDFLRIYQPEFYKKDSVGK